MKKSIGGLEAILFDMDGTLVNSIPAVERVWSSWAMRHGLNVEHVLHFIHGRPARDSIKALGPTLDLAFEEAWVLKSELEEKEGISALPGALEFLKSLVDFPWAIVTSADRPLAIHRLGLAQIELPKVLVSVNDVTRGKPDPEGYLMASKKLGVDPRNCLVIEDTIAGLEAGRRAGMQVLGITSSLTAQQLGIENAMANYVGALFKNGTLEW